MEHHLEILFVARLSLIILAERYMRVFFDKRRTRFPVMALSYLAFPLGLNATTALVIVSGELPLILAIIIFDIAPSVALLYVIALNYEGTLKKRLVAAVSIFAIGIAINYALAIVFGAYISAFADRVPRQSDVHLVFEMIVAALLSLTVALLLQNFKNIRRNTAVLPAVWVSVLAIPLASIAVVLLVAFADGISTPVQIFIICVMFGISVFVFYLLDRISASHAARIEAALHAQEKDNYAAQYRLMRESVGQMKAIRHDIKMHMTALKGLTLANKPEETAAYLDKLLGGIAETEQYSATGNIAIDSIINYKLKDAALENIQPELRLQVPPELNVELSDIAAILGNLLDNALEAVAKAEEKRIKLNIEYSRETLFIMTENTFDGVVVYAPDAGKGEKRIISRKAGGEAGSDHGHGLKNIRRAVEKYNGLVEISHTERVFSVALTMYVETP